MSKLLLIFLLIFMVGCQSPKQLEKRVLQVQAVGVVNGHVFEVMGLGDQPNLISHVRLIGIESPDIRQRPWGVEAKKRLEELILNQTIALEFDQLAKDRSGRTLAYVWKGEDLVNELLVREGLVLADARSPNHKYNLRMDRAQQWARLAGNGIWNPDQPMRTSPWEFRRENR